LITQKGTLEVVDVQKMICWFLDFWLWRLDDSWTLLCW